VDEVIDVLAQSYLRRHAVVGRLVAAEMGRILGGASEPERVSAEALLGMMGV
jgi:hypothetical protein